MTGQEYDLQSSEKIHPIIYTLVVNRYATYKELRDEYTIEEAIDLYEMCLINMYNKYQVQQENLRRLDNKHGRI